ncbi:hypothetical protein LJ655_25710 [Paraburkholderia sp. MMS20-SJTN17]|uniref:Uncharacterized protein n=1 Tax=Paraburkholderia translucens TaxID=2886945 RepID=A0ABS8KKH4_9BURK|nr:hypothetical protein [Paraburkholderia sp. MMS20-SJTN17]MCC8405230.1 hypothetical protein [Paraburkholderia sp. MMS20-SJTN17]
MMSMSLASLYRLAVFHPLEFVRQRAQARSAPGAREHVSADDPERLERIARYARAGYFNIAVTADTCQIIGEIAPD